MISDRRGTAPFSEKPRPNWKTFRPLLAGMARPPVAVGSRPLAVLCWLATANNERRLGPKQAKLMSTLTLGMKPLHDEGRAQKTDLLGRGRHSHQTEQKGLSWFARIRIAVAVLPWPAHPSLRSIEIQRSDPRGPEIHTLPTGGNRSAIVQRQLSRSTASLKHHSRENRKGSDGNTA